MQLTYRGQSYEVSFPQALPTRKLSTQLTYRGIHYTAATLEQGQPPMAELTYRGVRYAR
jgi:hypothetical protein